MKVILLENIKGVGRMGDVKNVADGYGRNFLLARGMAKIATEQNMKEVESLKKKAEASEKIKVEKAQELAERIKDTVIEIERKANEKGTLFDGIEKKDLAAALQSKLGLQIEEDMVKLEEPIKSIGKHTLDLELAPEIKTQIVVEVKAE